MTMIEKVEQALRAEVERQVQKQGAYSGPANDNPDYVDADLDYPAMCRAVLLAVRDADLPGTIHIEGVAIPANKVLPELMEYILEQYV